MTFARVLTILIVVVWGSIASGEAIPVSSGEHGTFSRLVFEGRAVRGWKYEKTGQDYLITFPDQRDGFKTDTIYKYIQDDRLKSFNAQRSQFKFKTNCACEIQVFEIGKTVLVVDIKETKPVQRESKSNQPGLWPVPMGTVLLQYGAQLSKAKIPVPKPLNKRSSNLRPLTRKSPKMPISDRLTNRVTSEAQTEVLQEIQVQLLQEISMASSRGILRPDLGSMSPEGDGRRPQVDVSVFDSSQVQVGREQAKTQQIRITSSADILGSEEPANLTTSSGKICIDPLRVDISAWSDGRPFEQQLGERRRELYGEFDKIDVNNAIELARLYLHFGFGAEALNIMNLIGGSSKEWPEIFEIAQVLEYGFVQHGQTLRQYGDCNSAGALWGILANKALKSNEVVNVQAALRAVDSLPIHLRKFLAPELSARLLNYGDQTGAKTAMRNLDRTSEPANDRATLARAEIEVSKGELDTAGSLLQDVVDSNSEFSARALIGLIETEMAMGRSIDVAIASLVDAYSMELRDSPIGAELQRVHVLALAKSGQFHKSFSALEDLNLDEDAKPLRSELLKFLVLDADDAVFVELIFARMSELISVDKTAVIVQAAVRLQSLGFSETAEQFLNDAQVGAKTQLQKLLRARIALDLERSAEADAYLINLDGTEAKKLRAQAKEKKLDRKSAYDLYVQLEEPQSAQNNAWLSSDWQTLTDPNMAAYGPLVPISNRSLEQPKKTEGMMTRTLSLLEESLMTRELIGSILATSSE